MRKTPLSHLAPNVWSVPLSADDVRKCARYQNQIYAQGLSERVLFAYRMVTCHDKSCSSRACRLFCVNYCTFRRDMKLTQLLRPISVWTRKCGQNHVLQKLVIKTRIYKKSWHQCHITPNCDIQSPLYENKTHQYQGCDVLVNASRGTVNSAGLVTMAWESLNDRTLFASRTNAGGRRRSLCNAT